MLGRYYVRMTYRDLDVFQRSYKLAVKIHKFSLGLVKERQFDIADQIRRASRSIPSNIAEGFGRSKSKPDTINQLRTALGSNDEMLFNLEFMKDVDLLQIRDFQEFSDEYTIVGKELFGLIKKLKDLHAMAKAV